MTLAAQAALGMAGEERAPDALILATTTPPYDEGGSTQILVELLRLPSSTVTIELSSSARDGLVALRLADALVGSGLDPVIICAAHRCCDGGDGDSGDGAIALVMSSHGELGQVEPRAANAEELRERWRLRGDVTPREADASFVQDFGGARVARELAERVLGEADRGASVRVAGPGLRAAGRVEEGLGGPGDQAGPRTGLLGAAHPLLRLLTSLDEPGFLAAASGGVGELIRLEPGGAAAGTASAARAAVAAGAEVEQPFPAPSQVGFEPYASAPRAWRERRQDLRLEGVVRGGRLSYPPPAGLDGPWAPLPRSGRVLTMTRDHVYPGADTVEMAVLELDGGGRFYGQVASGETVAMGDPVRLVPRRLHAGGGIVQYFWKVASCR